jgi:hypothetical protein
MKPKFFQVLEMCIDSGITRGYNRAFKHNDNPSEQEIIDNISKAIVEDIFEWFDIDE